MSDSYIIRPNPADPRLTERVSGVDQSGARIETSVTVERALTIFLNAQEIVTAMTINDYPEYLALGYLLNQNMLLPDDEVTGIDYDEDTFILPAWCRRARFHGTSARWTFSCMPASARVCRGHCPRR